MEESKPFASSSVFRPKLNDEDYMELVCENGQILAKARRSKSNNSLEIRRVSSLLDLYETEYDESFKKTTIDHNSFKTFADSQVVPVRESYRDREQSNKFDQESERDVSKSSKRVESSTLIDNSLKGSKTVNATRSLPDEQSVAVNGRSNRLNFVSSSTLSRGNSSFCPLRRRKYAEIEEESAYISSNLDDESDDDVRTQVTSSKAVFKRRRVSQVHHFSERKRVNEINKRMRVLQDLLPNGDKEDKESLLDEAIKYMRTLQFQVQMMSMGTMMLPMPLYSPMAMGNHMGAAPLPQFLPQTVQGYGLASLNDTNSQMIRLLPNPATGLVPLESCIHQAQAQFQTQTQAQAQAQATSPAELQKSSATPNLLDDAMQFRGF